MKKYLRWKYFERFMSVFQFFIFLFIVVFIIFVLHNSVARKNSTESQSPATVLESTNTPDNNSLPGIEDEDVFKQRQLRADENEKTNSIYYP